MYVIAARSNGLAGQCASEMAGEEAKRHAGASGRSHQQDQEPSAHEAHDDGG